MFPLRVLQPRRSFVPTLFLLLLVSLWTPSISAWIQQHQILGNRASHSQSSCCGGRGSCHEARVHRNELQDEQSTPSTVGKSLNIIPERHKGWLSSSHPHLSRRSLISMMLLVSSTTSLITIANAADATTTTIDPFATMDAIARGFESSGPSTEDSTPQAGTTSSSSSRAAAKPNPDSSSNTGNLSALEKALEESRKRKQIDPRTHG